MRERARGTNEEEEYNEKPDVYRPTKENSAASAFRVTCLPPTGASEGKTPSLGKEGIQRRRAGTEPTAEAAWWVGDNFESRICPTQMTNIRSLCRLLQVVVGPR